MLLFAAGVVISQLRLTLQVVVAALVVVVVVVLVVALVAVIVVTARVVVAPPYCVRYGWCCLCCQYSSSPYPY